LRICIFGAGAVGGNFAVRLANAGHEVSAVTRGENLKAIRANGLTLIAGERKLHAKIRASDKPAELGPQDLVICALKTTGLAALPDAIAPLLGPDTPVIFAQNGIPWWYSNGLNAARPKPPDLSRIDPGGALARTIEPRRVIGAVIWSANEVVSPGVIENRTPDSNLLVIGETDDRTTPRITELRALLEKAEILSPATPDIRKTLWTKLVQNLTGSTLCLLTQQPIAVLNQDPAIVEITKRMVAEARAIAAAHGIALEEQPNAPTAKPRQRSGAHKPSMLQDYERGRPMEIEAMIQTPAAFARAAGVATPTFDVIAALCARRAADKGLYTI
jgi:2-dehydropantoate 2-reductase